MRNCIVFAAALSAAVGVVGCAEPVTEDSGAIAQAADGTGIYQTLSAEGSITGAVNKAGGDEHRIRLYYDAERVLVRATGSDEIIDREWAISQTDYLTNDKRTFSLMMLVEPVSRMAIVRGFAGKSELTCTVDFSHMKQTGYGLVTRDWRPSGKSADFQTAKWDASKPRAPLGCDFEAQFEGLAKTMKRWSPLFAVYAPRWEGRVKTALERGNALGASPATTYKSAAFDFGPATLSPQDLFAKLTDNERLILERALVLAIAGGMTGAVGGAAGGPGGIILGAALGAASAYTAAVWAGYFEEKKRINDEKKATPGTGHTPYESTRQGRDQNGGDEPGRYGPPSPSDVGWDGRTGGQTRGGDDEGMQAGDIPPNTGAGTGNEGSYPGGSGPSGSGQGCTEGGGVGIGSIRVLTWCP